MSLQGLEFQTRLDARVGESGNDREIAGVEWGVVVDARTINALAAATGVGVWVLANPMLSTMYHTETFNLNR